MTYEWKSGTRLRADAQRVGEELERIEQRDAAAVVRAARKSKGALHGCFEWDDSKASEAYRLEQARYLLRMVVVVEEPEEKDAEPIRYRAYEAVRLEAPEEEDGPTPPMVYIPTRKALSDPELRPQIMARLEQTIHEAEQTAEQYTYLVPAFSKTKKKLREARETVRA